MPKRFFRQVVNTILQQIAKLFNSSYLFQLCISLMLMYSNGFWYHLFVCCSIFMEIKMILITIGICIYHCLNRLVGTQLVVSDYADKQQRI